MASSALQRSPVLPALTRTGALLWRARYVAAVIAIALVPWSALLGATLPSTYHARNWSMAWLGLDGAVAASAALTAWLLRRGDVRAALSATAGSTLLLVDAWFDTCTSAPGLDHGVALGEAIGVELPLAVGALWVAFTVLRRAVAAPGREG